MRVLPKKTLRNWLLITPLLLGSAALVHAQIEGPKRGIAPIASAGDFEVTGVSVNVVGKNAFEARQKGWEQASVTRASSEQRRWHSRQTKGP